MVGMRSGLLADWKTAFILFCLGPMLLSGCTGSSEAEEEVVEQVADELPAPADPPPSDPPDVSGPTLSFGASPTVVDEGTTTTLTWSTTDADSCTASGGWSGNRSASGSETVGPLSAGTTYSLSCTGSGGSVLEMISVSVVGPVQLSWVAPTENVDGSLLTDLAGFRIYYGAASRSYSDMVDVASADATSHTLSLTTGDYYVAMTALDAEGNESAYSNEVLKTRL